MCGASEGEQAIPARKERANTGYLRSCRPPRKDGTQRGVRQQTCMASPCLPRVAHITLRGTAPRSRFFHLNSIRQARGGPKILT